MALNMGKWEDKIDEGFTVGEEEYERRVKAHPMYAIQRGTSDSFHFTGDMEAFKEANGFMTGQEWYKKLDVELKVALLAHPKYGDEEEAQREYYDILAIAKKAAGIE